MFLYRTYFHLSAPVIDFDAAYHYLKDDDMSVYLKQDKRIPQSVRDAVEFIDWILRDEESGYIDLKTSSELSENDLEYISRYVSGQNSDGIGEGFSQQDFAYYKDRSYDRYDDDEDDDDYYDDDDYITASFDWITNEYKFEFVSNS